MKFIKLSMFLLGLVFLLVACKGDEEPQDNGNNNNGHQIQTYAISFYDETGELLATYDVESGHRPSHAYSVQSTQAWVRTFEGWTTTLGGTSVLSVLPVATANATYYASVSQVKQNYTVTFITNGGSSVAPVTVPYGNTIEEPTPPSKEGYAFVTWTKDANHQMPVDWPLTVQENMTLYASWNERVPVLDYLISLLNGFTFDPFEGVPVAMQPGGRLVDSALIDPDYTGFVSLSTVLHAGYGEQWQMVLDNLMQSKLFFNYLSVIEGLTTASVVAFNNYLDSNPSDVGFYQFDQGIYQVTITFEDSVIAYRVDFTTNVPALGEQTIQLAIDYNINTLERTGRIQIGNANALKYEITEDAYTFAIRYMGVRRAYFQIATQPDGRVEGKIFEYLGLDGTFHTSSSAFFVIDQSHVSVVGNKAGAMLGFTGTIVEVYSRGTGRLLGFEVKESLAGVTFNTLWLNLDEQSGINNVRLLDEANGNNPHTVYINGASTVFSTKNVGGLSLKRNSRRFDIEIKVQYVYHLVDGEVEKAALAVPMLFVQEEVLDMLTTDIVDVNANLSDFSLTTPTANIQKIKADYASMTVLFPTMKDDISVEYILEFIGDKIVHE